MAPRRSRKEVLEIPTLDDVLEEKKNLDLLCADRILKTSEMFAGNAFYSNDQIIKAAAGVAGDYSLKFIIPHGIVFSRTHCWVEER